MSHLLKIHMAESSVLFCRGREAYLTVMNHAISIAGHTKYEREILIQNRGKKIQSNKEIPNLLFTTRMDRCS